MESYTIVARKHLYPKELEDLHQIEYILNRFACNGIFTGITDQEIEKYAYLGAQKSDFIVAIGGVRTFHEVARGIFESRREIPILYLPNKANDMANNLNANYSFEDYIEDALFLGPNYIDTFSFGDDFFQCVGIAGCLSNVLKDIPEKKALSFKEKISLLERLKASLLGTRPYHLTLLIDGKIVEGDYLSVLFSNTKTIGGYDTFSSVKMKDNKCEVMLLKPTHYLNLIRQGLEVIKEEKMWSELKDIETYQGKNIHVIADRIFETPIYIDGKWTLIPKKKFQIAPYKRILAFNGMEHPFQIN